MTEPAQLALLPESHEEHVARIDSRVLWLLMGNAGGPLSLTLDANEKAVLSCLRYMRGSANAISIRELQERTKLDVRGVKQAVHDLRVNFHLPIGSSKHAERGGYFIMTSPEDVAIWSKDVLDQVRTEIAVLRAAAGHQAGLELLGQLHMEALAERSQEANNA